LEQIGCIRPNATYMNINFRNIERDTASWWVRLVLVENYSMFPYELILLFPL
jgi:hypothetical protein